MKTSLKQCYLIPFKIFEKIQTIPMKQRN